MPVEMDGSLLREDVPPGSATPDQHDKSDWRSDWRHPEPMYVRCPICFVGDPSEEKPDRAVVILDGNFSQKRLAGKSVLGRNKRPDHRLFVTPNSSPRYMSKVILFLPILYRQFADEWIRMTQTKPWTNLRLVSKP